MKDLTISAIDRQNILNNKKAVDNIQTYLGYYGNAFSRVSIDIRDNKFQTFMQ
jgi:hypothetical protein